METTAVYQYITTDLLTNEILAEIPFQGVSWSRAIRRAGEFSGSIPVIPETKHLDIYNSTMPGKTGLYILRNGVCVWGGIIWSREYDAENRTIDVSGAEFISYFYHRFVWKSLVSTFNNTTVNLYAMSEGVPIGSYLLEDGLATINTRPIEISAGGSLGRPHFLEIGDDIVLYNIDSRLEGGATVNEVIDETTFTFITNNDEDIPLTESTVALFRKSMDNYRFVRDIISRTAEDFAGLNVKRDEFLPGRTLTLSIIQKSKENGVSRITTAERHYLVPGSEVVVQDVDEMFDGRFTVSSVTSENTFEYENGGSDITETAEDGIRTLEIDQFSVIDKKVTISTVEDHNASVGDEVTVNAGRPQSKKTTITNPDMDLFDEPSQTITEVLNTKTFSYERTATSNGYWYFQRNIVKRGLDYQESPEKWIVTLEVDAPHNYLAAGKVQVIGLAAPYDSPKDGGHEILAVPMSTRLTYEINRSRKIIKKSSRSGVVTMFTKEAHGYLPGDTVVITGFGTLENKGYNGTWTIDQTPSVYKFIFKKEKTVKITGEWAKESKTINVNSGEDMSGIVAGMTVTGSGIGSSNKVDSVNTSNKKITLTDDTSGKAENVTLSMNADNESDTLSTSAEVKAIQNGMIVSGDGIAEGTRVTGVNTKTKKIKITPDTTAAISNKNITFKNPITLYIKYKDVNGTDDSPPANAYVKNITEVPFGSINKSNDEIITRTNMIKVNGGGKVVLGPRAYAGTYGGFAYNSDIGISFLEETNAGVYTNKNNFVGSDLQSVGEILEEISAGPDGFEYRIDCSYDEVTNQFIRTMVLSGYDYPDDPEPGEVRSIESLGANKYVFEYPGNIASFSLSESAEEAATRMWVTGSTDNIGDGARQPMAAASKRSLLRDGWPILDATEQVDGEDSTPRLFNQARSFLEESLPPIDELTVSVNGSLPPEVGSYLPGDWCSLLFEDEFMKQRLASDQEARDNIFVRKIYGYKVDVPDAFGIPEKVDLELIRDTEVDSYGDE